MPPARITGGEDPEQGRVAPPDLLCVHPRPGVSLALRRRAPFADLRRGRITRSGARAALVWRAEAPDLTSSKVSARGAIPSENCPQRDGADPACSLKLGITSVAK